MNRYEILGLSLLLVVLPLTSVSLNLYLFIGSSTVGLLITIFLMVRYRFWSGIKNAISSLYFSTAYAAGLTIATFLVLSSSIREFGYFSLIGLIPFLINLIDAVYQIKPKIGSDILRLGNGMFGFLIVVIIGAIIGRFLHNFYQDIIVYTGFIVAGILVYLYLRE
ncbi:hypothetical protein HS7_16560 [Sulfolobales archaeon HS-7]|nr:hypothetical protein HS7_16560 [Sulfolobales archaeon HS-7]